MHTTFKCKLDLEILIARRCYAADMSVHSVSCKFLLFNCPIEHYVSYLGQLFVSGAEAEAEISAL